MLPDITTVAVLVASPISEQEYRYATLAYLPVPVEQFQSRFQYEIYLRTRVSLVSLSLYCSSSNPFFVSDLQSSVWKWLYT